jgi:hypothetical protein
MRSVVDKMDEQSAAFYTDEARHFLVPVLIDRRKLEEAETIAREVLDATNRRMEGDPLGTIEKRHTLGWVLVERGKAEEALPILEQVVSDCKALLPGGYIETSHFQTSYGRCLTALGRFVQAEPVLLKAYAAESRMRPNPEHIRIRRCVQSLVELYEAWEQEEKAAQWREKL